MPFSSSDTHDTVLGSVFNLRFWKSGFKLCHMCQKKIFLGGLFLFSFDLLLELEPPLGFPHRIALRFYVLDFVVVVAPQLLVQGKLARPEPVRYLLEPVIVVAERLIVGGAGRAAQGCSRGPN